MAVFEIVFDIGSQYISAALKKDGFMDKIPSVVAVAAQDDKQVVAVGVDALRLANSGNNGVKIVRPILEGAIIDVEGAKALVSTLLSRLVNYKMSAFSRYNVLCAVPCGMIGTDKKVIESVFLSLGARQVSFVEAPLADSYKLFGEFCTRQGIVLDIGYDCADVAVVSGGIASGCTVYHAGKHLTEAIAERIRNKYMLNISTAVAEHLKTNCASLYPNDATIVHIVGQNVQQGTEEQVSISAKELYDTVVEFVKKYVLIIQSMLADTANELSSVRADGIMLCGGGARLAGLDLYLKGELGLPVRVANTPEDVCIHGLLQANR